MIQSHPLMPVFPWRGPLSICWTEYGQGRKISAQKLRITGIQKALQRFHNLVGLHHKNMLTANEMPGSDKDLSRRLDVWFWPGMGR